MTAGVYLVGGSKGGVGKSLVSMALLDYFEQGEQTPMLIETDQSNSDVAKAYPHVPSLTVDLNQSEGWMELLNSIEESPDTPVVINSAAGSLLGMVEFGGNLKEVARELGRRLVVVWPINRGRDSIEAATDVQKAMPGVAFYVLRNTYFSPPAKFEFFNGTKFCKALEEAGPDKGGVLDFPDLADRVADCFYTERKSIAAARQGMPIGNRVELDRWRSEVRKVIERLV